MKRSAPTQHIAILRRAYLDAILAGDKTMEARLAMTRQAPFRRVHAGDVIWLKESSGPFRGRAIVRRVRFLDGLDPADIRALRARHEHAILGGPDFWRAKRHSRCATLLWLDRIDAVSAGPAYRHIPGGRAWYVLGATAIGKRGNVSHNGCRTVETHEVRGDVALGPMGGFHGRRVGDLRRFEGHRATCGQRGSADTRGDAHRSRSA